jgi:hypothetical protein
MTPAQTASGRALIALILGIATFICCGFFSGIPAFFLGRAEEKAIDRSEAPEAGRTFAKIGWILGLVGTLLNCISLIGMGFYIWKVGIPQMPQKGF